MTYYSTETVFRVLDAYSSALDESGEETDVIDNIRTVFQSIPSVDIDEEDEPSSSVNTGMTLGISITRADDVVVAVISDENGGEITRGHGHIIHDGILGEAQAASYAIKRAYTAMPGADSTMEYDPDGLLPKFNGAKRI